MSKVMGIELFQEEAYSDIIEWQIAKDDIVSALATYRTYLDMVVQELNICPSPRMKTLHRLLVSKGRSTGRV
jgi:DNA-binding SARP family transcriptional activator